MTDWKLVEFLNCSLTWRLYKVSDIVFVINVCKSSDSGVGMTREELIESLGTIAHSGTAKFLKALKVMILLDRCNGTHLCVIGQSLCIMVCL